MKRALAGLLAACTVASTAQGADTPVPFKLGTFERNGRRFVGMVVKDSLVIDIASADAALEPGPNSLARLSDMKDADRALRHGPSRSHPDDRRPDADAPPPSRLRHGPRQREDAAADPLPDDDAQRRRELPRARARDGRPDHEPVGRARAGHGAARHHEHPGHLGAQAGRRALEPLHVREAAERRDRRGRGDPAAARPHADRLGVRARRRDRARGAAGATSSARPTTSSATRSRTTCRTAAAAATRATAATG